MSEPQSSPEISNKKTIIFMVVLSLVCALILSMLASALAQPKEIAKELDRSKQMMIAAKVYDYAGYFLMPDENGGYIPAKVMPNGEFVKGSTADIATNDQLLDVYNKRFIPILVDANGNKTSFKEANINYEEYLAKYKKTGYYKESEKLLYEILPSGPTEGQEPIGYVIPVNGYGLWDAIYGYLALKPDLDTVIGISWYDQKETPGLGANIAEPSWQSQFPGKLIFMPPANGQTDYKTAPLGLTVVKGKVIDVLGDSPKAKSAVDGMAGATLTGNGVTEAYRDVLETYRPFFVKAHQQSSKG